MQNLVLRKLFALRFPYEHSKMFGADMSIYPECNAWRHFFLVSRISANVLKLQTYKI